MLCIRTHKETLNVQETQFIYMEEYDRISSGMQVNADDYLKVNEVDSGGVAIARHVEVNEITSGGIVICETASQLEKITSGGTLICRNLNSINFTPRRDYNAFTTLGAYLSQLKRDYEVAEEEDDFFQETIEKDIKEVKQLMDEVDLEV